MGDMQTQTSPQNEYSVNADAIIDKDLVIIGAGPAGMSAALYAKRALLDCVVLEQEGVGGQMIVTDQIDNYLGIPAVNGYDLSQLMKKHVESLDVELSMERAGTLECVEETPDYPAHFIVKSSKHSYRTLSVIIGCGATAKEAEFKGESDFTGHGISYCATCDAMFYRNKDVYVVGGGNSALEESLFLARFAKSVTILVRRDVLRAQEGFIKQIEDAENIHIVYNTKIKEVAGDDPSGFSKLVLENTKDHTLTEINCEPREIGIFVFAGRKPMNQLVGDFVETDDKGFIITDERMATKTHGLYAAGDIRSKILRQLITAASDGACAGTAASSYVRDLKRAHKKKYSAK